MRLGIFGGSFDPVHLGHLLLADCCCDQAELDEVWFVPTARQPLKPAGPQASDLHRLAMLQHACAPVLKYKTCTIELDRGGVSYSIDTLEQIATEQSYADLFFLMGADSLAEFPTWRRPDDICRLATPLVVHRAETDEPDFEVLRPFVSDDRLNQIRRQLVVMLPTPISSSHVRDLIAEGGDWQQYVPASVADYIQQHQLYTNGGTRSEE